jgi:FkbM family methyltransferase
MRRIILHGKGKFYIEDDRLLLEITHKKLGKKYVFDIENDALLSVLQIYVDTCYLFYDAKNSYVVLDIGMNIGDTALLFSSYENVERVYSFEPFKPTYQMAMRNFALNKDVAKKIVPYNFGISDKDRNLSVSYSVERSGNMSSFNNVSVEKRNDMHESIVIKSIEHIFDNVLPLPPPENGKKSPYKLLMKIDCEGDEFEIFNKMDEKDLFKYVDCIMLEWHRRDFKMLIDILEKHHFVSFSLLNAYDASSGTLYCVKQN